jgi:hypothetical protein
MRIRILGLLCFGLMATLATSAKANFVTNGEFETPNIGANGVVTYGFGSTAITGWTVVAGANSPAGTGSVDLVGSSFFPSTDGVGQSIDLDGTTPPNSAGGITQLISGLTAGSTYTLSFYYANNPGANSASAMVSIDGLSTTITHSGSVATSLAGMNYTLATYTFTATASNTLSFISTDPTADLNGIVLDNVSITGPTVVPEPASCAMLGLGLLAVGAYTRARRRTA